MEIVDSSSGYGVVCSQLELAFVDLCSLVPSAGVCVCVRVSVYACMLV